MKSQVTEKGERGGRVAAARGAVRHGLVYSMVIIRTEFRLSWSARFWYSLVDLVVRERS